MKIINYDLIGGLKFDELYGLDDYDELDLTNEKVLEELKKVKIINIIFRENIFSSTDRELSIYNQLCLLIENCPNLENVRIRSGNNENLKFVADSLFKNLMNNKKINIINLSGFNFSYDYIFEYLKMNGIETRLLLNKIYNPDSEIDFLRLGQQIHKNVIIDSFKNLELKQLCYNHLPIEYSMYKKYYNDLINYTSFNIVISNISELTVEELFELKKDTRIEGIKIKAGWEASNTIYTIDELIEIRRNIDELFSKISIPDIKDPNREKIIFSQIYAILGKNIVYDHYAVSEEGKKDEQLKIDCRNLRNGLLGVTRNGKKIKMAVCSGYATILQNIATLFDIKCNYISSFSPEIEEEGVFKFGGPRDYKNGTNDPMGHAYNLVTLDGKKYLCDLTWDADYIKTNDFLPYFLVSYDDFAINHKDVGFPEGIRETLSETGERVKLDKNEISDSLSSDKQLELMRIEIETTIEEYKNRSYLGGFVNKVLSFIEQCDSKTQLKDYSRILRDIGVLERYILSDEFKEIASQLSLGKGLFMEYNHNGQNKNIVFYYGGRDPKELIEEVVKESNNRWKR